MDDTLPEDNDNAPEPESELEQFQKHANSLRAFDTLGKFLEDDGWYPQRAEGQYAYWVHYSGSNGDLRCYAQIRLELEQFVVYAMSPVKSPPELLPAVAEFLTRANYGLGIGNFELRYSDGRIRFKSSLDFEGDELSPNLIRNTIYPAVRISNTYLPGLMKVIYGGGSPEEAIAEIEGS
ncbi:MAG TPA: YbjN domain-containing protein [Roseiflexaceae bacterium]|nr:YbjN domain-containing protein [Roseiflexaceae bacterium]